MKKLYKNSAVAVVVASLLFGLSGPLVTFAAGPDTVPLGTAGNFVILSKVAITTTGVTSITGDIGVSPVAAGAMTGFGLILDSTECFSTTDPVSLVTGKVYAADYSTNGCTTPAILTTAVSDMEAAYTDAATRTPGTGATNLNVGDGTLTGNNFAPGTYTWNGPTSNVTITEDITLTGTASDIWIFQIAGTLDISASKKVLLSGGAQASNIFWAVAGTTTLESGSTFEGNILAGPAVSTIAMQLGATLHGRALGQKDVTLIGNTISATAPLSSAKDITSFSFPEGTGVITGTDIAVIVPSGTNLTALIPTIAITGVSVSPLSGVAENFTDPAVTYTVTAEDASIKVYMVTVTTYYNDIIKAADRLVALQNVNGSWDWVVTDQTGPTATTYYNVSGVTAQALLDAYALNNDQTYLDAAKRAGDFIVGTAISPSQRQNAFNVVFLQDLAVASASSTYSAKANDILTSIFTGDNYWVNNNGSNCAVTGCTADQLVAAYANYRSGNRGLVPWDVMPFVSAEVSAGNMSLAQSIVDAIVADTANYTNGAANYDLGLAGKVIAAAAVSDPNLSAYAAELASRQNGDGSFGLALDGQVQTTAYALRALTAAGGNASAADGAATFIGLQFGYSGLDGWKDTDNTEYAETDSEAAHALFGILPLNIPYAIFPNVITQTGTSGNVTVTVEIPQGTAVTGDSSWNGVISEPTETTATVTVPGFDTTITSAITVGSSDSDLTFDKAARLVFAGQAGVHVGWYNHAGTFAEITADCAVTGGDNEASQTANLGAGANCKMDVGADLVVWTKHFTTFVTYTQTPVPPRQTPPMAPGGGGGGGGGGSGGIAFGVPSWLTPGTAPVTVVAPIGQVLGATTFNFASDLRIGMRNEDVNELQDRLIREGVYSGPVTGYFGPLTLAGIKVYQDKYGISPTGTLDALTRAQLNGSQVAGASTANAAAIRGQIAGLQAQLMTLLQQLVQMLQAQVR